MGYGVDLHFVEDVHGVFIISVFGWFEDHFEPFRVGVVFFIQDDAADGVEIGSL